MFKLVLYLLVNLGIYVLTSDSIVTQEIYVVHSLAHALSL